MSMLGTNVVRTEDPALLTEGGKYVDDLPAEGALHAVFVRSMIAHGTIAGIEIDDAAEMPGVVAILTAADLDLTPNPPGMPMFNAAMTRTRLASERVRYVGEPIAVVLAESQVQAADGRRTGLRRHRRARPGHLGPRRPERRDHPPPRCRHQHGVRPAGVGRRRVRRLRRHRRAVVPQPPTRTVPARTARRDRPLGDRRRSRAPHAMVGEPGRPRHPRRPRRRTRCRARPGARHHARRRWRLRRQERQLPRGHRGRDGRPPSRAAGALGGDAHREHARPRARPGPGDHRLDRRHP